MTRAAKDRSEEAIARWVVSNALPDTTVARYDDGSRDGMVDAIITYGDQRRAALEIVTDTDPGYRRVWARIKKHGGQVIPAPALKHTWDISLADHAKIREIQQEIVGILTLIEEPPISLELGWPDGRRWRDHLDYAEVFERLGVLRATPISEGRESPKVILSPRAVSGWHGPPDVVAEWIGRFLTTTAQDVSAKLAASEHGERHAFIWTTFTTDYPVLSVLMSEGLPTKPPDLPSGVDHVWIGALEGNGRVLRWQPGPGWSQVCRIPPDGRVACQ